MPPSGPTPHDVRLTGFADRVPVERAEAWLDALPVALPEVEVDLAEAVGRIPVAPLTAPGPLPAGACAGDDGYAVHAAETVGASAYDPVVLRVEPAGAPLPPHGAALVAAGTALPPGADAVVSFEAAHAVGQVLELIAAVAEGAGVERAGQQLRAGAPLASGGRPLRPHEAALLAASGVGRLRVRGRPRVRLLVTGAKAGAPGGDAHGPMLRALVERDGGLAEAWAAGDLRADLVRAATAPGADLLLVTGRTGTGPDDEAPLALAAAGRLDLHGVAMRPGSSSGMGLVGARPVLLLPGDPVACLVAYELLAGRLVRRLGGRNPGLPHQTREAEVGRKIVSAVGALDVCQVRLVAGRVEPLGVLEWGGLAAAARADGFVLVPPALEGYPPGARVTVHVY